jgi:biotin transport system ATP-binding protein
MGPAHLVLDEPLAGLDWPARRSVLAHLRDVSAAGTAVVIVTHDLRDVLAPADRLVVLADGRVVRQGPPDALGEALAAYGVRPPGTEGDGRPSRRPAAGDDGDGYHGRTGRGEADRDRPEG